jgi:hypothetical protein
MQVRKASNRDPEVRLAESVHSRMIERNHPSLPWCRKR